MVVWYARCGGGELVMVVVTKYAGFTDNERIDQKD